MEELAEIISKTRASVVRLALYQDRKQISSGSGFIVDGRVVTNSHVIRGLKFDSIEITFGDNDVNPIEPVRIGRDDLYSWVLNESSEASFDYAIIDIHKEPEFHGRAGFALVSADDVAQVGDQVLFFGFPFGSNVLTSHTGYISAIYREQHTHKIQIDGSINPGNSGGPLFHLKSGKVIGLITRTETGLEKDFDALVDAVRGNLQVLSKSQGRVLIAGVDPINATGVTMTILGRLAKNLKRSANVGIGWAFCIEHVISDLESKTA